MDKIKNISVGDPIYHPVYGYVQCMGMVTESEFSDTPAIPHRWLLWTQIDEDGHYKAITETNGELEVMPIGKWVMVWLQGQYCHQKKSVDVTPHLAKVTSVDGEYCSLEVYNGDNLNDATFYTKVFDICLADITPIFKECA